MGSRKTGKRRRGGIAGLLKKLAPGGRSGDGPSSRASPLCVEVAHRLIGRVKERRRGDHLLRVERLAMKLEHLMHLARQPALTRRKHG